MGRAALAEGLKVQGQALAVALAASAIKAFARRDDHRRGLRLVGEAGQPPDQYADLGALDVQ